MQDSYDYIIIGAGSAGCAIANRLSADPGNAVLLIESGPADKGLFVDMPRGLGILVNPGSKFIWEYDVKTGGNGPSERWFRGRTLGGSSSINGMIYMRGAPLDYDGWAANGCTGWSWADVGPKFAELENHDQGAGDGRGGSGEQRITTHPRGEPLYEAIIDAATELGVARVADVNTLTSVRDGGIGYQTTTRKGPVRWSAARAFLDPVKQRRNLHIATLTHVLRIEFTDQRATGVRLRDAVGERSVRARREIIVSAGAIETPKLLQLSGIGPAPLLKSFGIEVVVDAPDVGRNLRDHRHADLRLKVSGGSQNTQLSGLSALWSMLRYLFGKKGPMTHAAHEVGGFAKSEPGLDHADIQFGLMTVSTGEPDKDGKIGLDPYPGVTFVTYFTRPESQGEVRIQSADPAVPPLVDANHLATELDRQKFVSVFRWNRRLAQAPALKGWVLEESEQTRRLETDEDILANAIAMSGTCFHTAGTARMGVDDTAVVDPRLRVRGVTGLRVADTSIMPTLVSGNTNGPAMMIGLRAAEMILADNR